jgi:hypothetical protein
MPWPLNPQGKIPGYPLDKELGVSLRASLKIFGQTGTIRKIIYAYCNNKEKPILVVLLIFYVLALFVDIPNDILRLMSNIVFHYR